MSFLQNDLLGQASAYNQSKPDPDIKVRTALDRAAARTGGKFAGHPDIEASIRDTMGQTYTDLGTLPGGAEAIRTGAGFGAAGARGDESAHPQNHEPPCPGSRAPGQIPRG